jgi:hypothetical protein
MKEETTCVDPTCQWTKVDSTACKPTAAKPKCSNPVWDTKSCSWNCVTDVKPTGLCKENNAAGTVSIMQCFNFITEATCPSTCRWEPFTAPVFECRATNAASTQHCEKIDLKDTCYESGPNGELCEWVPKDQAPGGVVDPNGPAVNPVNYNGPCQPLPVTTSTVDKDICYKSTEQT